jgi:hypothetical protein
MSRNRIRNSTNLLRLASAAFLVCSITPLKGQNDTLKGRSGTQTVTFEQFDGQNFHVRDQKSGNKQSLPRLNVYELSLEQPRMADVVMAGKPKPEQLLLKGYANGRFVFSIGGKDQNIVGMDVRSIRPLPVSSSAPAAAAAPGGSQGVPMQQIPDRDIQTLLGRPGLTPDQKRILEEYKAAKAEYNKFQSESSALVSAMDTLTGNQRQQALNQLRLRKEQEQPVRRRMETSQQAVLAAFPELLTGSPATTAAPGTSGMEIPAETITLTMPPLSENEVLIIDTAVFRQLGNLSDAQSNALISYDAAAHAYQKAAANPAASNADALLENLTKAQHNLFAAFPNVKVINQSR